jgi:hypothetical protein
VGVLLVAGHAGDGVVRDNHGGGGVVVGDIDKARDARVDEGGVADDGDGGFRAGGFDLIRPWSMEMDAPISMVVSMALSGAADPRV